MSSPRVSLGSRIAESFQARFYKSNESCVTMEGRVFEPAMSVTAIATTKSYWHSMSRFVGTSIDIGKLTADSRELMQWCSRPTQGWILRPFGRKSAVKP